MNESLFDEGKLNRSFLIQCIIEAICWLTMAYFSPKLLMLWLLGTTAYSIGVKNEKYAPGIRSIANWRWADLLGFIALIALTILSWAVIL